MKNLIILTFSFLSLVLACSESAPSADASEKAEKAELIVYEKFEQLAPHFQKNNDTTYVINFWATWCKPCVEELPYFETLHNTYQDKPVKVLLVSLDFPNQINSKLIPFIKNRQLKSDVVALTDPDMNSWIPQVDPEWSGAIPATLIYQDQQREFHETSFATFEELNSIIEPFLTF